MNKDSSDSTTLIFKYIPKQIEDLTALLESLHIPAKQIKPFGRKRALITYEFKNQAEQALETLRELKFSGKPVNVSLFCKIKPTENKEEKHNVNIKKCHKGVQTTLMEANETLQTGDLTKLQVSKYVQKLYALEGELGFEQPPPPYLKYSYPPINKDILDNICISLLSNKRFYTQVLHLMNRMNLEPPFNKRRYKFTPLGVPKETGTQTEEVIVQEKTLLEKTDDGQLEKDLEEESELESSGEDVCKVRPHILVKRKLPSQEDEYKKKARRILQTAKKLSKETAKKQTSKYLSLKDIFDTPEPSTAATNKIELQLKHADRPKEEKKFPINLPLDVNVQKLSSDELENLPIYKNYQQGQASNKLYVKNLHKDVTTEDLRLLYARYLEDQSIHLDIKVMQHGRMKGQAFVTFQCDQMASIQPIIAKALEETNGLILRNKPMVVCYGKLT